MIWGASAVPAACRSKQGSGDGDLSLLQLLQCASSNPVPVTLAWKLLAVKIVAAVCHELAPFWREDEVGDTDLLPAKTRSVCQALVGLAVDVAAEHGEMTAAIQVAQRAGDVRLQVQRAGNREAFARDGEQLGDGGVVDAGVGGQRGLVVEGQPIVPQAMGVELAGGVDESVAATQRSLVNRDQRRGILRIDFEIVPLDGLSCARGRGGGCGGVTLTGTVCGGCAVAAVAAVSITVAKVIALRCPSHPELGANR